jgi:hypothetical protein
MTLCYTNAYFKYNFINIEKYARYSLAYVTRGSCRVESVAMKHRLYIDEVGNADLGSSNDPNHRYLSLTGVIFELEFVSTTVFPAIEQLKRDFFRSHPDEPIVLHRKELVNKRPPFTSLQDPSVEEAFNNSLLGLIQNLEYAVITVVIDKLEHSKRHQGGHVDPYHHCLGIIVMQYVHWLEGKFVQGDVMVESRGGKEDMRLKDAFEEIYIQGFHEMKPENFATYLTSRQLKVKPKISNIAGLQLADIIAHPSFRTILADRDNVPLPANFGGKIGRILRESKYIRNADGQVDGWGTVWIA